MTMNKVLCPKTNKEIVVIFHAFVLFERRERDSTIDWQKNVKLSVHMQNLWACESSGMTWNRV